MEVALGVILLIAAWACLLKKREKMVVDIEHDNVHIKGKQLMAEMNVTQKIKLTATVDGAVDWHTFEGHIATGDSVELEAIPGEFAYFAKAVQVGQSVVGFSVVNSNGDVLGALVEINVVDVAATTLTITEGTPEPL